MPVRPSRPGLAWRREEDAQPLGSVAIPPIPTEPFLTAFRCLGNWRREASG